MLVENPNVGQHIDGHGFLPGISALFDEPMGDGEAGRFVITFRLTGFPYPGLASPFK